MELHSIDATLSGSSEEMCAGYLEGSFSKGSSSSKIVPRFEASDRALLFLLTGLCALLVVGGTALGVLYAQSSGPGPAGGLAWNYSVLQEEQQRLAVELLHLQGELDRVTSLYSSMRENRSLLWNELESLKNKHSGLQTKFTNISETHSALIRTLTDFRASAEEHLSRAALNYSSLQSDQEELEAKLRTLQNDLASLSSSFSEVKENSSSLWHQLDVLTDQSSLRIKLDNLSDTLSALMKTLADAQSSGPGPAGGLAWNYSVLQEEQQRLAVELLHLQGELDRVTSLYSSMRENRSLLWNELESLKNKHSGLQTKFTNISETHSALIRTLTDFRASAEEHLSRSALNYSSLQSDQEELEAKLRTLQNNLASLSSSFSEVKENSSSLWHQLDVLTDQSSLRIKLDNLSDTLSALMKTLAEAKPRKTCPDHWELFRRKCYFFSSDKESWGTSRDRCASAGGSLVIIKSQEEQKFLTSKLAEQIRSYDDSYWIGLNDLAAEGSWRWVDDTSLDARTTFWASVLGGREPDNWSQVDPQGEDCVHIGIHNTFQEAWYDASCKLKFRRICETTL